MVSRIKQYLGMALVVAGVILLALSWVTGLANFNIVLFIGLFLILAGVVCYVWQQKSGAKY